MPTMEELLDSLEPDPWRQANAFSAEIDECHSVLFDSTQSRTVKAQMLSKWLMSSQPCLFGRIAAMQSRMDFCILTEADVAKGDEYLRELIQAHRNVWKSNALLGASHGFVILFVSKRLAHSEPSPVLLEIALRLCELYLSRSEPDKILLDELILRVFDHRSSKYSNRKWKVGVNYFGAHADGRWWQDHRIPGGIGFSMNSVGHMARKMVEDAIKSNAELAERAESLPYEKLVKWALPLAMRTIHKASEGIRPGTRLADRADTPLPIGISEEVRATILGKALCPFNEDFYYGRYHTDISIPSEYFNPVVICPHDNEQELLFTYLHRESDEDYLCMGLGEEVLKTLKLDGFREL